MFVVLNPDKLRLTPGMGPALAPLSEREKRWAEGAQRLARAKRHAATY